VSQRDNARPWIVPAVWALMITMLLGVAFIGVSWPFNDVYSRFYTATTSSWRDTIVNAFASGVEYRPLFVIGVKLAHQLAGLRLWFYQTLVLLQFAAVLAGLLWILRPLTWTRAAAACIALACVAGLHSSRVLFTIFPLNQHSFGAVLLIAAILLALSPRSRATEWAFLPLTLAALLVLESGVLVVAVAVVLWTMRAPGTSGRMVTGTLVAAVVYAAVRFTFGTQTVTGVHAETGLGFADVTAQQLGEIFVHAPWLLWLYNLVASVLTIAVSEPRAGKYVFIESILHGRVPLWMYIHVVTSVVTTGVIVFAFATSRIAAARDRYIAAAGVTLVILGSALGVLYTRDRVALSAGIGYAMLAYVAVAAVLEGRPERRAGLAIATTCVAVIAAGWLIRTGEAYFQLRDVAWENYQEWTARYEELGGTTQPQTDVLMRLRQAALERLPDDPRNDPAWTYAVFEREFERNR